MAQEDQGGGCSNSSGKRSKSKLEGRGGRDARVTRDIGEVDLTGQPLVFDEDIIRGYQECILWG